MIDGGTVSLAAQSFGEQGDPAVILVMGATASMLWWPDEICRRIADVGLFVIRFDHRDTGASGSVPLGTVDYGIEDMADDVLQVLDGLGTDAAHLVGMSLGGLIGQLLAQRDPARILTLTLIAAEPLGGEAIDVPPITPAFMAHFVKMSGLDWTDRAAVTDFLFEIARLSAAPERGPDEALVRRRIAAELDRAGDVSPAFNHASVGGDLDRWDLRSITQPTLVIHGAHDPIVAPSNGTAIARQVPGARTLMLLDAGHELHGADLALIADAVIAHIRSASQAMPSG